jgi:hypothetical protein
VKLQITDMRTGERHVIDGEDAHVEARLRLLYPGPTENVADGHLGNVIHAVARVQHVGVVPLEHGVPMPAPVQKSESGAGGGLTVWRVENDKGEGPYRGGLTFAPRLPYPQEELVPGSGKPGSPVDIDDRRPMPHIDFEHAHHEALKSGHLKSGFASPEHAVRWFGREGLDVLQQRGFVLRPVLASKVHQSRSGRQVAFEPSVQKSEAEPGGGTLEKARETLAEVPLDLIDHSNRRESPGEHGDDRGAVIDGIRQSLAAGHPVERPRIYLDPLAPESGRYHVFDGHTRLTAYREHGAKTVPVRVIPNEWVSRYWSRAYGPKKLT